VCDQADRRVDLLAERAQRREDAFLRSARRRGDFDAVQRPGRGVERHEIGERSTDVDADAQRADRAVGVCHAGCKDLSFK
jgi:hypothetical protein